jgi:hypothetical protein
VNEEAIARARDNDDDDDDNDNNKVAPMNATNAYGRIQVRCIHF